MTKCPICGETARKDSVSEDGIILVCPNNHRFERRLTPTQKRAEILKELGKSPDDLMKRNNRLRRRRNTNE